MPQLTELQRLIRATRVGASEVGALMPGGHPYRTRAAIYHRLRQGYSIEEGSTQAMRLGHLMEPAVARAWQAEYGAGVDIRACTHTYAHPRAPLAATPDYWILDGQGLLEVKVSGDYGLWVELPTWVYWQAQAQLACTGRRYVTVVVHLGAGLRTWTVEPDRADIGRMLAACIQAWAEVEAGTPPPLDYARDSERVILDLTAGAVAYGDGLLEATGALELVGDNYAAAVRARRALTAAETVARAAFLEHLTANGGDAATLIVGERWRAERKDGRLTFRAY